MEDFLKLVLDSIEFLWPFRRVEEWEAGLVYWCGRYQKTVSKGVYPVIPWFIDIKPISLAEMIIIGDRQDVTIRDGSVVSYVPTMILRVSDPYLALNEVEEYKDTAKEMLAAVTAEKLAEVAAERLIPEKRPRLLLDLTKWVGDHGKEYGLLVKKVGFASFVQNPKIHRLLVDQSNGKSSGLPAVAG